MLKNPLLHVTFFELDICTKICAGFVEILKLLKVNIILPFSSISHFKQGT